MSVERIKELAKTRTEEMYRANSDQALQAVVELLLVDFSAGDVSEKLRAWADYIDERR